MLLCIKNQDTNMIDLLAKDTVGYQHLFWMQVLLLHHPHLWEDIQQDWAIMVLLIWLHASKQQLCNIRPCSFHVIIVMENFTSVDKHIQGCQSWWWFQSHEEAHSNWIDGVHHPLVHLTAAHNHLHAHTLSLHPPVSNQTLYSWHYNRPFLAHILSNENVIAHGSSATRYIASSLPNLLGFITTSTDANLSVGQPNTTTEPSFRISSESSSLFLQQKQKSRD